MTHIMRSHLIASTHMHGKPGSRVYHEGALSLSDRGGPLTVWYAGYRVALIRNDDTLEFILPGKIMRMHYSGFSQMLRKWFGLSMFHMTPYYYRIGRSSEDSSVYFRGIRYALLTRACLNPKYERCVDKAKLREWVKLYGEGKRKLLGAIALGMADNVQPIIPNRAHLTDEDFIAYLRDNSKVDELLPPLLGAAGIALRLGKMSPGRNTFLVKTIDKYLQSRAESFRITFGVYGDNYD